MYCAYELTRKDEAVGKDGVEAEEYEQNLGENLQSLVDRLKSGTYRAPAVKWVYIPKVGNNEKRPPGIPTFEDKILQRAVQMARTGGPMEPIYEGEFAD
jgi:retron-type reverse transcriptase